MVNRIRFGLFHNLRSAAPASAMPLAALSLLMAVVGCSGGGVSLIAIQPATAQVLDAGQTLSITASVINDAPAYGAAYSLSGPGALSPETISRVGSTSLVTVTYTAPATVAAQAAVTITATSQNTPSQTATVSITLYPALVISTTMLPSGQVGVAYSAPITSTGGAGSIAWSISAGALPTGLSISSTTGAISGNPTAFGTYTFTVSAQDATTTKIPTTATYTITIAAPTPKITTTSLPNGLAGTAYGQQLTYTGGNGGTAAFNYTGSLPAGLTLSSAGLISGTPTVASSGSTYNFAVSVTIGTQTSAVVNLSITIPAYPTVTTTTLPNGNIGISYSKQLTYNGGAGGTVTWAISPATAFTGSGLSLNTSTGVISGTPTAGTTYSFSVTVTVGTQTSAAQPLSLTVYALDITSASSANGEVNLPFSFQLTAAGGTPGYTWKVLSNGNPLPVGLTLNASTGLITGTPTTQATTTGVNIQATDTASNTATTAMTFAISAARSGANNSELSGSYAFLLSGFDATGYPLAAAGTFTADGNGNITGGSIDADGSNPADKLANQALLAATYRVGTDNRGKLTLSYGATSLTFTMVANGISSSIANSGYLTEFDNSGQSLTGTLALRSSSAYSLASFNGGYAFGLQGAGVNATASAPTHRSVAGAITFNGSGGFSAGEYAQSASTSGAPLTPSSVSLTIAGTGRGTLAIGQPAGSSGASTLNFTVYVVNAAKLYVLSADTASGTAGTGGVNDLLYGQMLQQTSSSFSSASLSGNAIVRMQSLPATLPSGSTYTDARVGIYTFNGTTVQFSGDENAGGAPKTLAQTAAYSVNTNGRVQANFPVSGLSGCTNCVGGGNTYFYLVGTNQGFVMDFTTAAVAGYFEPQTAPGITTSSFSGNYAAGTVLPLAQAATYLSGEFVSAGSGAVNGTVDENTAGTLTPNLAFSGTYAAAASGRFTFTALGSGNSVLYIVSPTRAILLDVGASSPVIEEVVQ